MLTQFERTFLLSSRFKHSSVLDKLLKFVFTYHYRQEKPPTLGVITNGCRNIADECILLSSMKYLQVEEYVRAWEKNGTHSYRLTDKGFERLSAEIKKYTNEQQKESTDQ